MQWHSAINIFQGSTTSLTLWLTIHLSLSTAYLVTSIHIKFRSVWWLTFDQAGLSSRFTTVCFDTPPFWHQFLHITSSIFTNKIYTNVTPALRHSVNQLPIETVAAKMTFFCGQIFYNHLVFFNKLIIITVSSFTALLTSLDTATPTEIFFGWMPDNYLPGNRRTAADNQLKLLAAAMSAKWSAGNISEFIIVIWPGEAFVSAESIIIRWDGLNFFIRRWDFREPLRQWRLLF